MLGKYFAERPYSHPDLELLTLLLPPPVLELQTFYSTLAVGFTAWEEVKGWSVLDYRYP